MSNSIDKMISDFGL